MLYAIVDIETTGGFAAGNCITEIAILIHDGIEVRERFVTLINPQMGIPLYIQSLTGITEEMTADAPLFTHVAAQIYALLHDKVFVAHHVNFDFSFVRHQLQQCGYDLQCNKICTLQMSRRLLPGYSSYSLGKLCDALKIPLLARHRAGGDADATAILFTHLLQQDSEGYIVKSLTHKTKHYKLPPNLSEEIMNGLPSSPGVYYFRDQKGKIIYIGKALNLKKRISSHFSGNNISRQRQDFLKRIHHIDFTRCGTELMALILEADEIKKYWPSNNRALKRFEQKFGLYSFEDQNGYLRLGIDKIDKQKKAIHQFDTLLVAYQTLKDIIRKYKLCEKLCFIQRNRNSCTEIESGNCNGACIGQEFPGEYNPRVMDAIGHFSSALPNILLVDRGRELDEKSIIWIEDGKFIGMGYFSFDQDINDRSLLRSCLVPYGSNDYVINLVLKHAEAHPELIISQLPPIEM